MINPILRMEWLGKIIKIVDSNNHSLIGVEGKIIDETKNTFVIQVKTKRIKVMKNICVFQIIHKGEEHHINGELLLKRSEDRIKIK